MELVKDPLLLDIGIYLYVPVLQKWHNIIQMAIGIPTTVRQRKTRMSMRLTMLYIESVGKHTNRQIS